MHEEKRFDVDAGCQYGEKCCTFCGEKGVANVLLDRPDAPLQFVKPHGEDHAVWMCKTCRQAQALPSNATHDTP